MPVDDAQFALLLKAVQEIERHLAVLATVAQDSARLRSLAASSAT